MTRLECELKLIEAMEAAFAIYRQYNPQGQRLSMLFCDGQVNVSAIANGVDMKTADFGDTLNTYAVYATKFPDGDIWFGDKWATIGK